MLSILLKGLDLRFHLRKFELYIYLGSTLNLIKAISSLPSYFPNKYEISTFSAEWKLFLEISKEGRRDWFP